MPTREQLETALGEAWKAMAKKEGHSPGVPKQFVPSQSDSDALADTLLRLMKKRPGATLRTLSGQLNTTLDDTRRRMANLMRRGDVRCTGGKYEVTK
jgi:predicted HTH transcriptional regulator